jgi:hypothetical protein
VWRHDEESGNLLVCLPASDPGEDLGRSVCQAAPVRLVIGVRIEALAKRIQERPQELEQVSITLGEIAVGLPPADVEVPRDARWRREPEAHLVLDS